MYSFLLYFFASLAVTSAMMVILSKNPIYSVIFLILAFCNATGLLLLLKVEFIAMMFIIIYVGAIAVLFLFVVMMLNIKINELSENWWHYLPIGGILGLIFFCQIEVVLYFSQYSDYALEITALSSSIDQVESFLIEREGYQSTWGSLVDLVTNIQALGFLIYTYNAYYFIMASLILLVAMIGAIVLTMYKRKNAAATVSGVARKDRKQFIYKQVARDFGQAIDYVDYK